VVSNEKVIGQFRREEDNSLPIINPTFQVGVHAAALWWRRGNRVADAMDHVAPPLQNRVKRDWIIATKLKMYK